LMKLPRTLALVMKRSMTGFNHHSAIVMLPNGLMFIPRFNVFNPHAAVREEWMFC